MISLLQLQPLNIPKTMQCNKQTKYLILENSQTNILRSMKWKSPKWHLRIQLIYLHMLLHSTLHRQTDGRTDCLRLQVFCCWIYAAVGFDTLVYSLWFTFVKRNPYPLLLFCVLYTHCFWPFQMAWRDFHRLYFHSAVHSTPQPFWDILRGGTKELREFYICFIENEITTSENMSWVTVTVTVWLYTVYRRRRL